jgi:hypothetical protein
MTGNWSAMTVLERCRVPCWMLKGKFKNHMRILQGYGNKRENRG